MLTKFFSQILRGFRSSAAVAPRGRALLCLLGFVFVGARGGVSAEAARDPRGPGTIRMAERLQKLAAQANPVNNIFLNAERAKLLQVEFAKAKDPGERLSLQYSLACELLDSGQNTEALHEFEAAEEVFKGFNPEGFKRNWSKFKLKEALCWMRIGEITNCLA